MRFLIARTYGGEDGKVGILGALLVDGSDHNLDGGRATALIETDSDMDVL